MKTENIDFLKQVIASLSSNKLMTQHNIYSTYDGEGNAQLNAKNIIKQAVEIVEAFEAAEISIRRGEFK